MGRTILIALMCVGLVGCQASTSPSRVAQLDRRHAVSMMRADWDGQYTLYVLPSDPKGKQTVVQAAHLKKNDPLGFRQRETGAVAVAGDLEIPLASGEYEWIMQADKGQTNYLATTGLVLVIVAIVVGILVIIVAVSASHVRVKLNPGAFGGL